MTPGSGTAVGEAAKPGGDGVGVLERFEGQIIVVGVVVSVVFVIGGRRPTVEGARVGDPTFVVGHAIAVMIRIRILAAAAAAGDGDGGRGRLAVTTNDGDATADFQGGSRPGGVVQIHGHDIQLGLDLLAAPVLAAERRDRRGIRRRAHTRPQEAHVIVMGVIGGGQRGEWAGEIVQLQRRWRGGVILQSSSWSECKIGARRQSNLTISVYRKQGETDRGSIDRRHRPRWRRTPMEIRSAGVGWTGSSIYRRIRDSGDRTRRLFTRKADGNERAAEAEETGKVRIEDGLVGGRKAQAGEIT